MRKITIAAAMLFCILQANAQQPDSVAMKNWMKYMTPGKEHAMMASWDGVWTGDVTMWMTPGAPPSKSTSTTTNKMVMEGRYQQSTHEGSFEGMPFQGMSMLAFDNAKKMFINTWVDNMGTGMMIGKGKWNDKDHSITFTGTMVDPTTGKDCNFREVFKVVDADHQILTMYGPDPVSGKEFRTMEIQYTRKG